MARDAIQYDRLMQEAVRGVDVRVLRDAVVHGLPGKHHFLISFRTRYPGVDISDDLRGRYPQDMTIVLQHQYWDLKADDTGFSVTLSFNQVPQRLSIPYAAITGFADPEVKFELHFPPREVAEAGAPPARPTLALAPAPAVTAPSDDGKVVPLDTFRRK